jgi:hypothetical protein
VSKSFARRKAGWKYGLEAAVMITARTRILLKRNGRHEETRTPDLYRVKGHLTITLNNLHPVCGSLNTPKYA